ncbi:MAG: hypothetical protein EOO61_01780 [Hymenobacter sp.]|nr:MAG: hypothetical protein EOO61_01780 [Hymenobacter sp.]
MYSSVVEMPHDSPQYLGLTFDKYFSRAELREMQHAFKKMASKYRCFPNLNSACRFMHEHLLNHERFPTYLVSPAALGAATLILFKAKSPTPFVATQRCITCLLSESEFIRFTIKGHEAAGLWMRNGYSNQGELVRQRYTFNVDLSVHYEGEFLLYGDNLASDIQQLLKQIMTLL